jgi:hypothetical protein
MGPNQYVVRFGFSAFVVGKGRCRGATSEISQTRQCLVSRQSNSCVLKGRRISPVPSRRFYFCHQHSPRRASPRVGLKQAGFSTANHAKYANMTEKNPFPCFALSSFYHTEISLFAYSAYFAVKIPCSCSLLSFNGC